MDLEKLRKNLKARGMDFFYAATAEEAKQHLLEQVQNTTVGIGGSKTVEALGLYDELVKSNDVHWHWKDGTAPEVYQDANSAEVYLASANGLAETGEIINIDGTGNRIAALTYAVGKRIFLLVGRNKVCPDLVSAIERARTVAAPINMQRFPGKRPCMGTEQCADCRSPDRGCCTMQIMMYKPMRCKSVEVVLIGENLGY